MINITNKIKCSGCSACAQICPKGCITMKEDSEGFLYPYVEHKECINCGLCEKICPIMDNCSNSDDIELSYAAYAYDDELRMKSSSGGIFSLCAEWILSQSGIVFGAAFDENFMVHHIAINKKTDLSLLRGSKYLQSRIENTYKEAKTYLDEGKKVLYTGTECQISGLINFLGKTYDNLYTIDVLCHGVPSPKVWKNFLKEKEKMYGGVVSQVFFRSKKYGWKRHAVKLQFDNQTEYQELFSKDMFMQLFLRNICLRPSCYECQFKKLSRNSDLSIGDCWGIENYMPEMDDDKGTSIILIHSIKGNEMFDEIRDRLIYKKTDVDKALPPYSDSRKSVKPHKRRSEFFKKLNKNKSLEKLVKITEPVWLRKILGQMKRKIKNFLK